MPRLVRRKPLLDRVKDYLNPGDFLLWLSEEFETRDWDGTRFGVPLALGLHIVMLVARANSGRLSRNSRDDVFGDMSSSSGWFSYIATFIVHLLTYFSIANAIFTFSRKRHYRLFESAIDAPQSTPSARRVRVDSSPVSSSPLRFLSSILGDNSIESRIHPDPTRDVWELAVWDPLPICLRVFCFFSPGHVLVYWLFLPTLSTDPRPSVTVFTAILLQCLMSSQLYLLQSHFSQQEKDSAVIHREVMNEYDTKFVHPRLNPLMRDVGTQFSEQGQDENMDTYTPAVILRRGFRTNPNPNYAKHVDPDNISGISKVLSPAPNFTPSMYNSREPTPFTGLTPRTAIRQPQFGKSSHNATGTSTGDGGSLGVFSHANSPLKKSSSAYDIQSGGSRGYPKNSFDMAGREIQEERERQRSPGKRQSENYRPLLSKGGIPFSELDHERRSSAPKALGAKPRQSDYGTAMSRGQPRW